MTNWETITPNNCITLNSPPTVEVIRIDKEGFHYQGRFIADAGEAHELMVKFLRQNSLTPVEPMRDWRVALKWIKRLADDLDNWSCNTQYTDKTVAEARFYLASHAS
jgi:hypothetical protein